MSEELFEQLLAGDRAALARAVTIVESVHPDHVKIAGHSLKKLFSIITKALELASLEFRV